MGSFAWVKNFPFRSRPFVVHEDGGIDQERQSTTRLERLLSEREKRADVSCNASVPARCIESAFSAP